MEHLSASSMRKTGTADGAWPWASAPDMLNVCASISRYVFVMNRGGPVASCQGNCTASDCRGIRWSKCGHSEASGISANYRALSFLVPWDPGNTSPHGHLDHLHSTS